MNLETLGAIVGAAAVALVSHHAGLDLAEMVRFALRLLLGGM